MFREWHQIADYEVPPAELEDKELRALSGVWVEQKSTLHESAGSAKFLERLKREWAIETGLIERLYTLDRGIAQLLIERGIPATKMWRRRWNRLGFIIDSRKSIHFRMEMEGSLEHLRH